MALLNFDANQVAPDMGVMDPVPEGWYNVMIDESELAPTKNGDGAILKLRFKVVDGTFIGRNIYGRLNIRNANEVAQRIALAQLSAIAHAVGVLQVADSQMLHNLPLKIRVKVTEQEGYAPSNDIIAYKNINEAVETVKAAPVAVAPIPAAFVPPAPMPAIMPTAIPAAIPAILGQAPAQAWAQPAPVAAVVPAPIPAPVVADTAPPAAWATTMPPVAPVTVPVAEPVVVAVAAPVADAPFDPAQPPAWMTK